MIFVTTGTSRLPFDRLVNEIERMATAGVFGDDRVLIQYRGGSFQPNRCELVEALSFGEMLQTVQHARLVIGHGGAGTLLLCRDHPSLPILFARRANLGENHDDHQVPFCEYVAKQGLAFYANEIEDLENLVLNLLDGSTPKSAHEETERLVAALHSLTCEWSPEVAK
jgi:UDP-N-acetylglucosamine transferase subunit ALG13